MIFRYVAYTLQQGIVTGRIEATSAANARAEVLRQGFRPLTVKPVHRLPHAEDIFPSLFRVRTGELTRLSRHLATILASGGSLLRGLELLQEETSNGAMARTLEALRRTLDKGGSLSDALREHPTVFNPLFVSVVEVGEYTGRLAPALEQMADILEKEQEAKRKAIKTLMYPAAIMGLAVVTMTMLMLVAMPPMLKVFENMGTEIPLPTRIILTSFNLIKAWFIPMAVSAIAIVVLLLLMRRISTVRYWMDLAQVKTPLVGPLVVSAELSRASRTISMLLEAGVSLAIALGLAISGCKNRVLQQAFVEAEDSMMDGKGLTPAFKRHPILPRVFVELVVIGEETNSLQRTMNDAAVAYSKQLDERLNKLLGMLEPISTVVVGAIVGLIAFSMFLPIYSGLDGLG